MSELKPCPFCRSADVRIIEKRNSSVPCAYGFCFSCDARGSSVGNFNRDETLRIAAECWNTRAAHPAVEVLDELVNWLGASPFDKIQIANVEKKIAALRAERGV